MRATLIAKRRSGAHWFASSISKSSDAAAGTARTRSAFNCYQDAVDGRNFMTSKNPARRGHRAVNRRKFLTSVALASAATAVAPRIASSATHSFDPVSADRSRVMHPMRLAAAETPVPSELSRIHGVPGSDFMVDVIKTLNIKYLTANPASSLRGIHESLINYGGN